MILKERINAKNVLFFDGLKHNLLSVHKMCDQGHELVFMSKKLLVK